MKTITAQRGQRTPTGYAAKARLTQQKGMGATIVLFTIALIVLVGAALAYASRGNPTKINDQSAKVFAGVLLKQSADYRDGFSRYIFDGKDPAAMTFKVNLASTNDLFSTASQYSNYQNPPSQTTVAAADNVWLYKGSVTVDGVGTASGPESITYVANVVKAVCEQTNNQMYGTTVVPTMALADAAAVVGAAAFPATSPTTPGRANGCVQLSDGSYMFYSTLAES